MAHCHACHPGGEAGLGPALNDKPLPGLLVRLQVRTGMGAMPAFSPRELSDGELRDLIAYLGGAPARAG
jgi:mono/diheme cytochrome c family protein